MKKRGIKTFIAPASLPRRFLSCLIDLIIINVIVIVPFKKYLSGVIPSTMSFSEAYNFLELNKELQGTVLFVSLIIGIMTVLYFTVFEYKIHQTPGKILMKIEIIPEYNKLTFWNYLISNLTFLPVFPFFILWIIDPIYMIISPKNQRLMEKLTRILVVQKYTA